MTNLEKEPVCLSLISSIYRKFKKVCAKDLTTVSREVNRFMLKELERLEEVQK